MKIYINVKKAGSRRNVFDRVACELPPEVSSLRELLACLVREEVRKFNSRPERGDLLKYLCEKDIEAAAETGKVGFGVLYGHGKADEEAAVENAVACFEDGLVRVFKNGEELTELDAPADICEEDVLTLMRLTFLSGRMW